MVEAVGVVRLVLDSQRARDLEDGILVEVRVEATFVFAPPVQVSAAPISAKEFLGFAPPLSFGLQSPSFPLSPAALLDLVVIQARPWASAARNGATMNVIRRMSSAMK